MLVRGKKWHGKAYRFSYEISGGQLFQGTRKFRYYFKPANSDLEALYASMILYNLSLSSVKVSILLRYLRICITPISTRSCYAVLAFIVAYGIGAVFSNLFICTPIAYFWDSTNPKGTCVDETILYFTNAAINIFTDFTLLLLPALILRPLVMMPKYQKFVVMVLLAFGGL